MRDLQRTPAI